MDNRAGQILRNRRLELGLTQEQVALSLGMSIHQYQRYEYGEHKLSNCSCLTVPVQDERPVGIWGQRHLRFIKTERKALYTELLTSGRLNTYPADINEQATEQMLLLIKQIAEREGVTEQLKAQDQMLWVQRINNIRDRAIEIVNHELIYA